MNDKQLIKLLKNPSTRRKGFEDMVRQYSQPMYWKIRHIVFRHEDADDVLQNVFMKAWTRLDMFRGESSVSTWLYRICINESIDFIRKRRDKTLLNEGTPIGENHLADEYFDGNEAERKLQQAINILPDAQKTTFTLRYYDEMQYKEMSEILGTSEAGLKTNYHLAVKKIKEFLENND